MRRLVGYTARAIEVFSCIVLTLQRLQVAKRPLVRREAAYDTRGWLDPRRRRLLWSLYHGILPLRDTATREERAIVEELASPLLLGYDDHEAAILLNHALAIDYLLALVSCAPHALDQVELVRWTLLILIQLIAEVADQSFLLLLNPPGESPLGLKGLHFVHLRSFLLRGAAEQSSGHIS